MKNEIIKAINAFRSSTEKNKDFIFIKEIIEAIDKDVWQKNKAIIRDCFNQVDNPLEVNDIYLYKGKYWIVKAINGSTVKLTAMTSEQNIVHVEIDKLISAAVKANASEIKAGLENKKQDIENILSLFVES